MATCLARRLDFRLVRQVIGVRYCFSQDKLLLCKLRQQPRDLILIKPLKVCKRKSLKVYNLKLSSREGREGDFSADKRVRGLKLFTFDVRS